MKPSSAKAKGRRLCADVRDILLSVLGLEPDDIHVTSSGAPGKDLKLSPKARSHFPFVLEAKNQEALNVWESYSQAEEHWLKEMSREEVYPALVYKRNHSDIMITLSFEDFLHFAYQRGKHVLPKEKQDADAIGGIHLP